MTTPALTEAGGKRIWFAQALRAVACLTVVAIHYGSTFVTEPEVVSRICLFPPLTGLPLPGYLRPIGWLHSWGVFPSAVGVAVFFLVSGFVIPFSLERNSLRGFFIRRFFRIYPCLWVVQILVLGALTWQAHWHSTPFLYSPGVIASNAVLLNSYLAHLFIEPVCWSLLVEELFYLICALCAWRGVLGRPVAIGLIALGLTGISLVSFDARYLPGIRSQTALYWLGKNAGCVVFIFVGVVLHYLYRGTWKLRVGLPLILCLLGLYALCCYRGSTGDSLDSVVFFRGGLAALGIFVPLMLVNRWLPCNSWVNHVAQISYPLYLIHATLGYMVIRAVYLGTGSLYLGFAAALAVAVTLAALLHRLVERPGNELGRWLAARLTSGGDVREPLMQPIALVARSRESVYRVRSWSGLPWAAGPARASLWRSVPGCCSRR
jgi:peptidoglycan/LPS O-acetylase OafA/YrhL